MAYNAKLVVAADNIKWTPVTHDQAEESRLRADYEYKSYIRAELKDYRTRQWFGDDTNPNLDRLICSHNMLELLIAVSDVHIMLCTQTLRWPGIYLGLEIFACIPRYHDEVMALVDRLIEQSETIRTGIPRRNTRYLCPQLSELAKQSVDKLDIDRLNNLKKTIESLPSEINDTSTNKHRSLKRYIETQLHWLMPKSRSLIL